MDIHITKKTISIAAAVVLALVIGAGIGYAVELAANHSVNIVMSPPPSSAVQTTASMPSSSYPLIDPDAAYVSMQHFIINFEPLRTQLTDLQSQYSESTYLYFEYLNNTATIGLNSSGLFTAASTIKVPLAMAVYKLVEEGKLKLTDTYTLQPSDLDSGFGTLYKVGAGTSYTVQQLMAYMLEQSDDTAMNALTNVVKNIGISDPLEDVYDSMGWDYPPNFGSQPTYINIDTRTLSNMFTALYEATYDNVADSQQILSYLAQTPFNNTIVAGVPAAITVAHKIGVADQTKTYSDCGIVYAPERPYLICAAMAGGSEATADQFISQASKLAYEYVINN